MVGLASWYGQRHHGQATASGELFDMNKLTAAHRTLPFGTRLKVTNVDNGRSVVVRVNDRGPWVKDRVIDVSRAAGRALGMTGEGVARVEVVVLGAE
jgi:rare lipoprotein A